MFILVYILCILLLEPEHFNGVLVFADHFYVSKYFIKYPSNLSPVQTNSEFLQKQTNQGSFCLPFRPLVFLHINCYSLHI